MQRQTILTIRQSQNRFCREGGRPRAVRRRKRLECGRRRSADSPCGLVPKTTGRAGDDQQNDRNSQAGSRLHQPYGDNHAIQRLTSRHRGHHSPAHDGLRERTKRTTGARRSTNASTRQRLKNALGRIFRVWGIPTHTQAPKNGLKRLKTRFKAGSKKM